MAETAGPSVAVNSCEHFHQLVRGGADCREKHDNHWRYGDEDGDYGCRDELREDFTAHRVFPFKLERSTVTFCRTERAGFFDGHPRTSCGKVCQRVVVPT